MPTDSGLLTKAEKNPYVITWPHGNPKTGGVLTQYATTSKGAAKVVNTKLDDFADFARKYASADMNLVDVARTAANEAILKLEPKQEVEFRWVLDTLTGAAMQVKIARFW